ncbi:MAG: hypothetical protein KC983_04030 [Phycisphaerales bacterium]|nr:hypothetical protein [Phycisphaerales bacterium]
MTNASLSKSLAVLACAAIGVPTVAGDFVCPSIPCPADCAPDNGDGTAGNGIVNIDDLLAVINAFGGSGLCDIAPDNGDGTYGNGVINIDDVLAAINGFGACPDFVYQTPAANSEAEHIALSMLGPNGGLFALPALTNRVAQDLAAIRAFEPNLATQFNTQPWSGTSLIMTLDQGQPFDNFDCLNEFYGVTDITVLSSIGLWIVYFPSLHNSAQMATNYLAAPEVLTVSLDELLGGENFWIPTAPLNNVDATWIWNVDDGFTDCFDGCDCHYYYTFRVTAGGGVTLMNASTVGQPWCEFPF